MPIFNKRSVKELKTQLTGMSLESIRQLAQENPLIPLEEVTEGLTENVSGSGAVQNYCSLVLSQPDLALEDIPSIIPTQQSAREHAAYWMESLLPQSLGISTAVKQFCTTYGELSDQDIDQLTGGLNDPGGQEAFQTVMYFFRDIAKARSQEVTAFSGQLELFSDDLARDLGNFVVIKLTADQLYSAQNGLIPILQERLERLEENLNALNIRVIALAVPLALLGGALLTVLGVEIFLVGTFSVLGVLLLGALTIAVGVTSALLDRTVNQQAQTKREYVQTADELNRIQTNCFALQVVSDNFNSLVTSNIVANNAVIAMIRAWWDIADRFDRIADLVEESTEAETQQLVRLLLYEARDDAADLKKYAQECELNGILPIKPSEEIVRSLALPRSWSGIAVDSRTFTAFLQSKNRTNAYSAFGRLGRRSLCCLKAY